MMQVNSLRLLLFALLLVCFSCSRSDTATAFTSADLQKLRWIEGSWRGTGDVDKPFFERYRFESDTVLAVDTFPDEKLSTVDDTTRFELKDGEFTNGGDGARWVATVIDEGSITFEPIVKAKNSFKWQRNDDKSWTATLSWPEADGKPARQRVYQMKRWPE